MEQQWPSRPVQSRLLGFLALAIKPDLPQRPTSLFGAIMVSSFVMTTLGYGGAAWILARAVMAGAL